MLFLFQSKGCPIKASPVLRIIFGDVSDSRKMHLDSGIPATLSELHMLVKTFFDLKEDFRLQYMDEDFNAFMNLTSMSDVKDKGTLKVIYNPKPTLEEQFITLYPVETSTKQQCLHLPRNFQPWAFFSFILQ